jgi:protein TonB
MKSFLPWLVALTLGLFPSIPVLRAAPPEAKARISDDDARAREIEAEIARRTQVYQQRQRLRRRQIAGTVAEKRFEQYLAAFRRKIACSASRYYPEAARGKTYGEMIVTVSILADGSFEKAQVEQSSGSRILDDGAIDIARRAAPFAPFPPEIRTDTDALDITRTWTFTSLEMTEGVDDPCI